MQKPAWEEDGDVRVLVNVGNGCGLLEHALQLHCTQRTPSSTGCKDTPVGSYRRFSFTEDLRSGQTLCAESVSLSSPTCSCNLWYIPNSVQVYPAAGWYLLSMAHSKSACAPTLWPCSYYIAAEEGQQSLAQCLPSPRKRFMTGSLL